MGRVKTKISGSTLVETIVATLLVSVVVVVTLLSILNLIKSVQNSESQQMEYQLSKWSYQYQHNERVRMTPIATDRFVIEFGLELQNDGTNVTYCRVQSKKTGNSKTQYLWPSK